MGDYQLIERKPCGWADKAISRYRTHLINTLATQTRKHEKLRLSCTPNPRDL